MNVTALIGARIMKKSPNFIREGLKRKQLPFGSAVFNGKHRWSFYISEKLFKEYTGCTDEGLKGVEKT